MVFNSTATPLTEEAAAIEELRAALGEVPRLSVGPPLDEPSLLLRFVRGYGCNVKEATKAFEAMMAYRVEHGIDAAREEMFAASPNDVQPQPRWPIELPRFEPLVTLTGEGLVRPLGQSAEGNPATLVLLHHYDLKRVQKAGLTPLLVQLQQYIDEWWWCELCARSAAAGRLLARDDIIFVAKIGLFQFDIGCARIFSQVLAGAKHYPESVAHIMSVGNFRALVAMYNAVIRPFMPQHTKEKILVFGRDLESNTIRSGLNLEPATMEALLERTAQ